MARLLAALTPEDEHPEVRDALEEDEPERKPDSARQNTASAEGEQERIPEQAGDETVREAAVVTTPPRLATDQG